LRWKEEIRLVNAKEPIAHPPFQWAPSMSYRTTRGTLVYRL